TGRGWSAPFSTSMPRHAPGPAPTRWLPVFTSQFQEWVRASARRLVTAFGLERVNPNTLTVIGLFINAVSGVLVAAGFLVLGGVVLLLASVFDILDGAVARVT